MLDRPLERGEEAPIFGDVVRGDADAFVELCQECAVFVDDMHAVPCGTGIASRPAVDERGDHWCSSASLCCWLSGCRGMPGGRAFVDAGEIENSLAVIALNDLIVAANRVEHLRTQADVAHRAVPVLGLGHRDALPRLQHSFEGVEMMAVDLAHHCSALSLTRRQHTLHLACFGLQRCT